MVTGKVTETVPLCNLWQAESPDFDSGPHFFLQPLLIILWLKSMVKEVVFTLQARDSDIRMVAKILPSIVWISAEVRRCLVRVFLSNKSSAIWESSIKTIVRKLFLCTPKVVVLQVSALLSSPCVQKPPGSKCAMLCKVKSWPQRR